MKILEEFQVQFDTKEILQLLSSNNAKKKKDRKPSAELKAEISDLLKRAKEMIYPKVGYDFIDSENLQPRFLFKKSEQTVLVVCTIGKRLEDESSKYIAKGQLSQGVILDAIASHAAEQVAEYANDHIITEIKEMYQDKQFTVRFSPGYCQWTIEEGQELIFSMLPTQEIGIQLSNSYMMIPRKSISFAMNIGTKVDKKLGLRECETCNLKNCSFRRM
ncbi:MAG: vitamin B12 dependent-methionine synthase activation domain-containing protein [Candidatus Heimdallarchaeota archaeon]